MAIEIRELVVRATVTKSFNQKEKDHVGQGELRKLKKEILEDCRDWVKDYIRDLKSR